MIQAFSLFSGSSGNCFFLSDGKTQILIDAGVSASRINQSLKAIGSSLDDIDAIFVTHEHTDHTRGLSTISKYHDIPVHIKEKSARAMVFDDCPHLLRRMYIHKSDFEETVNDIKITSFKTPHDSCDSCGYIMEQNGIKIGFATDTGCITDNMIKSLSGCRACVIEANHDVAMLREGPYPAFLKARILSDKGHLSNENSGVLAGILSENGTTSFLLGHLSKENNLPSLAYGAVVQNVPRGTYLETAHPDDTVELKY